MCAIIFDEPERALFTAAIEASSRRLISAATYVETAMVVEGRIPSGGRVRLAQFLALTDADIVALTPLHATLGIDAFRRYGRGRHKAALNLGDCFSYALARATDDELLFKGQDFIHTDVRQAIH
jgi:ribonuclease VapC